MKPSIGRIVLERLECVSIWCRIGFHDFSKWTDMQQGPILFLDDMSDKVVREGGWYIRQRRVCQECGLVQLRDEERR